MSSERSGPPAEVAIDAELVRRLLAAQFPRWAGLPVRAGPGAGWDNVIYRLGADLAVRLPRRLVGADQVSQQHRWLPVLAGRLPLAIPVVAGLGVPGEGYPWPWSITSWLPGEIAAARRDTDLAAAAVRLAGFIAALRSVDVAGGPPAGEFRRDLARRDRSLDLMVAWTLLSASARRAFRAAPPADDAAWERGSGWALDFGLRCAAYASGNRLLSEIGTYTVSQVLTG